MTLILDGKKTAEKIKQELKKEIFNLKKTGIIPGLAVVLVGENPASQIYISHKEKVCAELGIHSRVVRLKKEIKEEALLRIVQKLNRDKKIHGILIQLPLPENINAGKIIEAVNPDKDVDCFHPRNIGQMVIGEGIFFPCTPFGIVELLKRYRLKIAGKDCVIIGRSQIVGRPLANILLKENATVTICHSQTSDLAKKCRQADILISAVGKTGLIRKNMVKKGAVVIDVGINRDKKGKLSGDVDFDSVRKIAAAITPVPGGVGPMTVVMLMKNTITACLLAENKL